MKDNLEKRFLELKDQFDIEEPTIGHFDRFQDRLNKQSDPKVIKWNPTTWKWLAVAASVLLMVGFWFGNYSAQGGMQLADISPEMEETQSFFVSTIQREIQKVNQERTDDNSQIIDDAFAQLNELEKKYEELTLELQESDEDKRIIYAMISNFQQRIEVLQNLLEQLEEINEIKVQLNEA